MKFINEESIKKVFTRVIDARSNIHIKNIYIDALTFRSGRAIIDSCDISVIHLAKDDTENDSILEFRGAEIGTIISDGVDVEIKRKGLKV